MQDSKSHSQPGFISIEEQQREARHDETGKIRKYLELAEKLFRATNVASAECRVD